LVENSDSTAGTVPATALMMKAGAMLKIKATINSGKISSVGQKFFFPVEGWQ
jgi:ABC-type xylose transport system substrate-binding protein